MLQPVAESHPLQRLTCFIFVRRAVENTAPARSHFLARSGRSTRWNCWKMNPIFSARKRVRPASSSRATSVPSTIARPDVGVSRPPNILMSVAFLPEPDGLHDGDPFAGLDAERHAVERAHAPELFSQILDFDQRSHSFSLLAPQNYSRLHPPQPPQRQSPSHCHERHHHHGQRKNLPARANGCGENSLAHPSRQRVTCKASDRPAGRSQCADLGQETAPRSARSIHRAPSSIPHPRAVPSRAPPLSRARIARSAPGSIRSSTRSAAASAAAGCPLFRPSLRRDRPQPS